MGMDWETTIATTLGSTGALGFFVWQLQTGLKAAIDKRLKDHEHKNAELLKDHEHANSKLLEDHRALLAQQNAFLVERHKADLQTVVNESHARNAVLVAKQGEVIGEVYARLVEAQRACERSMAPMKIVSGTSLSDEELRLSAFAAIRQFVEYFDKHDIFLNSGTAKVLESIFQQFNTASIPHYHESLGLTSTTAIEHYEEVDKSWMIIKKEIPNAKRELITDLRVLLGVKDAASSHG